MFYNIDYTAISIQINGWCRQKEILENSTFSNFVKSLWSYRFGFNLENYLSKAQPTKWKSLYMKFKTLEEYSYKFQLPSAHLS